MLETIFKAMLVTSCAGAALTAVTALAKPLTKKYFSAGWNYYIWLAVMLVMMLPVRFAPPRIIHEVSEQPAQTAVTQTQLQPQMTVSTGEVSVDPAQITQHEQTETVLPDVSQIAEKANDIVGILAEIWLIAALLLLSAKLASYAVFVRNMKKRSRVISCPEVRRYTKKRITVRIGENIASPLTIGIFRKTLLLPDVPLTDIQLANILAHETTHLNRNDILCKWLVTLVKCVHWFNPAVYFAAKQINAECEISCDAAVTESMSKAERLEYVDTILALLSDKNRKSIPLTTGMAGSRKMLERRFVMMTRNKRVNKGTRILSAALAAVTLAAAVFTSGVFADEVLNERYIIEVRNNGNLIEYENKPFFEDNTLYLPLRETFDKVGILGIVVGFGVGWRDGEAGVYIRTSATRENVDGTVEYDAQLYAVAPGSNVIHFGWREEGYTEDTRASVVVDETAPIIRNNTMYVPFSYIDYFLTTPNIYPVPDIALGYRVWDNNLGGTDRGPDFIRTMGDGEQIMYHALPDDIDCVTTGYSAKSPEYTIGEFFKRFRAGDFDGMKQYCTESCVNNYFGDDYFFGMSRAQIADVSVDFGEYVKSSNDFTARVVVYMTPHEKTSEKYLDGHFQGESQITFYMILLRQPDGGYKIDDIVWDR